MVSWRGDATQRECRRRRPGFRCLIDSMGVGPVFLVERAAMVYIQCRYGDVMTTQLARWGNSLALRLPKSIAMEAKLAEGDTVDVVVKDGSIVITRAARRYTIEELIKGITPKNRHKETDWGRPVGREVW